jgi:hypothetical protein
LVPRAVWPHKRNGRVAGSAPRSGRGGRRFKSCHSDQTSSIFKPFTEFFTEFFAGLCSPRPEQRDEGWQLWTTDRISSCATPSRARSGQHGSAAILALGAGSVAHAGVPLPVVAETTGMLTLATVVKRIAPSVVTIEGRGRVAAEPGTKRRQAGKGIALAARTK